MDNEIANVEKTDDTTHSVDEKEARRKQITELVTSYYNQFDFLQYESLEVLINKALELFLDSDYSIEEINDKIMEAIRERQKALMDRYEDDKIKNNHETLYGRLEELCRELNALNIDYQITGGLAGYLKYDVESDRMHHDIHIYLNESDFEKFMQVCEQFGYQFKDQRFSSARVLKDGIPVGEHDVVATDTNSDFHIGIFPFERKNDGSVVIKDYYHDENGKSYVQEEIELPELADEIFSGEEIDFRGTTVKITPPEYVYLLKSKNKKGEYQQDLLFLEEKIDHDKLMRLHMLSKDHSVIQNIAVEEDKITVSNPYNGDKNELDFMLNTPEPNTDQITSDSKKEGAKVFIKKNEPPKTEQPDSTNMNEEGAISNLIITTLAFITFVLCFIGIAIIYLVQM